jgi:hypothetical protein
MRHALLVVLLLAACKDHDKDLGTCVQPTGEFPSCFVNAPRYQCANKDSKFEIEAWSAGLLRCRSLGYTKYMNVAYDKDGTNVRIDLRNDIAWDAQQVLEKGGWVTLFKPH